METDKVRLPLLVLIMVLIGAPGACRADAADEAHAFRALLIERLGLMEQVAGYKWNAGRAINDPVREANVLKAALVRSRAAGLDPTIARRFVLAQMEAAKMVQRFSFQRWRETSVDRVPGIPDLDTVLRPRIGALSTALIAALAESDGRLQTCEAAAVLEPVPPAFSKVPQAWNVAVDGVLVGPVDCP